MLDKQSATSDEQQSVQQSSADGAQIRAPAITLPKCGGAIRGMGEKFAANPVSGTGSMNVPIVTYSDRSGFGPQLSLSYDSGIGNRPFGLGWSLSLTSITRKTDKGLPIYRDDAQAQADSDVFILVRRYRPCIEELFACIEPWTRQDSGDVHWHSISKDNILTFYGKDNNSRIFDPIDPNPDEDDP